MATIDLKLKTYEQLQFEVQKLITDKYLLEQQLEQYKNIVKEVRKKLKEHKQDLDYEPWSEYKIKGKILFDLITILDKGAD